MSTVSDAYRGLRLGDRWNQAPQWTRRVGMLLVIAFAFYLPFLNILPFAYIRTDLSSSGSDWASVLFLVGISGHFRVRVARIGLVGTGAAILVLSIVLLATSPIPP